MHALVNKYVEQLPTQALDATGKAQPVETVILGSSNGAIVVEAPSLDRIRQKLGKLENLRHASLDGEEVSSAGEPGEIRQRCPSK